MDKRITDIIQKELQAISDKKYETLNNIKIDQIDFNPFLLRVIGLQTPEDIARFTISQRIERSLVTSYGSRIQKIAKEIAERGTGVEGADICKERDGRRYYIQMKSGPNTVNKDISSELNRLLRSATRRNSGSVALLGMTYGKRERVSNIIQQYSQVDWIIGSEFWSFISDEPDCAAEIFRIASELTDRVPDGGLPYKERYEEKIQLLTEEIKRKYGEPPEMWEKLFKDNI